jgi:hypothetical protein
MEDNKTVILVSVGQLLATDIGESVKAFANIVKEQKKGWLFGCLSPEATVRAALAMDFAYYGTIDKYKTGKIGFEQFHAAIDRQIGIKTIPEEFRNSWNAMCKPKDDSDAVKIKQLLGLQNQKGFELCVVSATNKSQYDVVNQYLKEHGIDLKVTTSFEHGTINLGKLANVALEGKYNSNDKIISLHKSINENHLAVKPASFILNPVDSRRKNLALVLEDLLSIDSRGNSGADKSSDEMTPLLSMDQLTTKNVIYRNLIVNKTEQNNKMQVR